MTCCDVDLAAPRFGVVPGKPSAGPANTAAISSAITTYSGTRARLLLPAGSIYVDQANTSDNWSAKFPRRSLRPGTGRSRHVRHPDHRAGSR